MEVTRTELKCEGYDGVDVTLGKYTYVAPPLTLRALRMMLPKVENLSKSAVPTTDDFNTISELVHVTLKRNYPDLKIEDVEDGLDMKNIFQVMSSIMTASGLEAGNARAATEPVGQ